MRLINKAIKLLNKASAFENAAIKNIFASNIIDLQPFLNKKKESKSSDQYKLIFDMMSPEILFSGNNITVDLMHEARKKSNFPDPPSNSPVWLRFLLSIIDIEDSKKRNALYKREFVKGYFSNLSSKNSDIKEQAIKNLKEEEGLEKVNFIKECKQGKIKFFRIKKWALDYPLIFDNIDFFKENLISRASKLLIYKNKINVLKELSDCSVTNEFNSENMPLGTVLYLSKPYQEIYRTDKYTKIENNFWESSDKFSGSDLFINRLIMNSTKFEPTVFTKPIDYFINEINKFRPDEASIIETIDKILIHHPEKILTHESFIDDELINEFHDLPWVKDISY